ncbi:hypothetical protein [Brachybacterium sillae]|uniref:hypothetical protein n=1 Tax=Brachybacterium sillae TaxID=2810536 RepID=UPI00217DC640|nr:hypothetical protein [Brachybacterium sillae]
MLRSLRPQAQLVDDTIALGEGVSLRHEPSRRRPGRWALETPRVREQQHAPELPDSHGYGRAFAEGLPFGAERRALDLAWTLARRLGGAVVTDSGARLEPHPAQVRDLQVVALEALGADGLLALARAVEPTAAALPTAPDSDVAAVSVPVEQGYLLVARGPLDPVPTALAAAPWTAEAVSFTIQHHPQDPEEDALETPDAATGDRWTRVLRTAGHLALAVRGAVGGYVLDGEGVLVDPADLT